MEQSYLWDPYLDPRVPVRFLKSKELKYIEENKENQSNEQKVGEDKHGRRPTLRQTVSRMFTTKQCVSQMTAMRTQNNLWELLNNVPGRFLNTNIADVESNQLNMLVDDDRVPQRFVPLRPRKVYDPNKDPRIPLRFIEPKERKLSLEDKPSEYEQQGFKSVEGKPGEQKPTQPLRRTNSRTINRSIKQLMTDLVDKVDDENKENEDKNCEIISIFDSLYK